MQDIVGITKEQKHPLILRNEGLGGFATYNMKESLIINTSYYY